MGTSSKATSVLTIRIPRSLDHRLSVEARRMRRTRSEAARAILDAALTAEADDPVAEARRQSLRASRQGADQDTLDFIAAVSDERGWR
jgi:hypothetical protein